MLVQNNHCSSSNRSTTIFINKTSQWETMYLSVSELASCFATECHRKNEENDTFAHKQNKTVCLRDKRELCAENPIPHASFKCFAKGFNCSRACMSATMRRSIMQIPESLFEDIRIKIRQHFFLNFIPYDWYDHVIFPNFYLYEYFYNKHAYQIVHHS